MTPDEHGYGEGPWPLPAERFARHDGFADVARDFATRGVTMYIGGGAVVLILIIVVIVLLMRRG